MKLSNYYQAFFALVRAGLWEQDVRLLQFGNIDYPIINKLAEEQSVVGLIAAGIEHIVDTKPPKEDVWQIVGQALQLEHRNEAMNAFIRDVINRMRGAGIYTVLVKGQGVAQCYERPLWRACGDVDLIVDSDNYEKGKVFLSSMSDDSGEEDVDEKHWETHICSWEIELHGTLDSMCFPKMDAVVREVILNTTKEHNVRIWLNCDVEICLPSIDNDIIIVFAHFLKHFFRGGVGLRQICDWCRLMWVYRELIDRDLLLNRLISMGMVSEWKAFAAFAVEYLGASKDIFPLYSSANLWKRKASRIKNIILQTGNFGHNRDNSFYSKYPYLIQKVISFWRHTKEFIHQVSIFPLDSIRVWKWMMFNGLKVAFKAK